MVELSTPCTFPLVPRDFAAGGYVRVGTAGALYQVLTVQHGAPAHESDGVVGLTLQLTGMRDYTTGTVIQLRPVQPHDVPWDARVFDLEVPHDEPTYRTAMAGSSQDDDAAYNCLRHGLTAICTAGDGAPFEDAYRDAGGGYEGLQAIATAALRMADQFAAPRTTPDGSEIA